MVHSFRYHMIIEIYKKFRKRCEVIRVEKLRKNSASMIQAFLTGIAKMKGRTLLDRQNR